MYGSTWKLVVCQYCGNERITDADKQWMCVFCGKKSTIRRTKVICQSKDYSYVQKTYQVRANKKAKLIKQ